MQSSLRMRIFPAPAQAGRRFKAADRIIDYAQKHYGSADTKDMKVLRKRLMLAGIYDPRGVAFFFIARTALAVGLAVAAMLFAPG